MSEPTPYDNEIATRLKTIIGELRHLETSLYNRHNGCVCNEQGLCSHHAMVDDRILDGIDKLMLAVKECQRVE